jgi:hypothetical protein
VSRGEDRSLWVFEVAPGYLAAKMLAPMPGSCQVGPRAAHGCLQLQPQGQGHGPRACAWQRPVHACACESGRPSVAPSSASARRRAWPSALTGSTWPPWRRTPPPTPPLSWYSRWAPAASGLGSGWAVAGLRCRHVPSRQNYTCALPLQALPLAAPRPAPLRPYACTYARVPGRTAAAPPAPAAPPHSAARPSPSLRPRPAGPRAGALHAAGHRPARLQRAGVLAGRARAAGAEQRPAPGALRPGLWPRAAAAGAGGPGGAAACLALLASSAGTLPPLFALGGERGGLPHSAPVLAFPQRQPPMPSPLAHLPTCPLARLPTCPPPPLARLPRRSTRWAAACWRWTPPAASC